MGCSSSTARKQGFGVIPLNAAQKYLVRETWEIIEPQKSDIGKKLMLRFFELDPSFQKLFPEFRNVSSEELRNAKALHGHAKRIMKGVENAVSAMDDAESIAAYLEELGRRHVARAMKPAYLDAMRDALMWVLAELLQSQWTSETSRAWKELFTFISQCTSVMGCTSSSTVRKQGFGVMPLTTAQKYLVRETWETIEPQKNDIGKRLMLRFFEIDPSLQKLFPEFRNASLEELKKAKFLNGHAKRTMKGIENAVSAMDDAESIAAYLEELGRRHATRAMKPAYLDAMNDALMWVLADVLKHQWTSETSQAWKQLFTFITECMVRGLRS